MTIFNLYLNLLIAVRSSLHSLLGINLGFCSRIGRLAGRADAFDAKISGKRFVHFLGRATALGIQSSKLKGVPLRKKGLK